MKKDKKRMNLLTFALSCMGVVFMFLLTGCGNGCGQKPECDSAKDGALEVSYMSLPLCGGCTTSGWGCNSCLWGENCYTAAVEYDDSASNDLVYITCGEIYYGSSCIGCGYDRFSTYVGTATGSVGNKDILGCVYGNSSDDSEYICGYYDGCACATKSDGNTFAYIGDAVDSYIEYKKLEEFVNKL